MVNIHAHRRARTCIPCPLELNYDPNMLEMVNVSNGGFFSQDGQA